MLRRLALTIAALLALPAIAAAQDPALSVQSAVVTAVAAQPAIAGVWRISEPRPSEASQWSVERKSTEASKPVELRPRDEWVSNDGFRVRGARIAYSRRF